MIIADLQSVQEAHEPESTLGEIESWMRSDYSDDSVWVIVEGVDDRKIFEPFFNDNTLVREAADERKQCGCDNLYVIVNTIVAGGFDRIIGIRDTDYTPYNGLPTNDHVFCTDHHDIEIQMLESHEVQAGIKRKKPMFSQSLKSAYETMRFVGYLRAYSIAINCSFSFDIYMKASNIWDQNAKRHVCGWRKKLWDAFFATEPQGKFPAPDKHGFCNYVGTHNLLEEPATRLCQGHDVSLFLQWTGAVTDIYTKFKEYYSYAAFQQSFLYDNIKTWADGKDYDILRC